MYRVALGVTKPYGTNSPRLRCRWLHYVDVLFEQPDIFCVYVVNLKLQKPMACGNVSCELGRHFLQTLLRKQH